MKWGSEQFSPLRALYWLTVNFVVIYSRVRPVLKECLAESSSVHPCVSSAITRATAVIKPFNY
jgi:hypothetical protein